MRVYALIARMRTQIFIQLTYYTNSKILSIPIVQTALRQRQHAIAYCREPRLFSQSLPRRKSLLSVRAGTKSPATISQDYLLGGACKARKRRIQTAPRLWQSPTMLSFRGAKRRGNPLNRNVNTVAIATDLACSHNHYRAENLCYQFEQGQNLLPQFRKIVCLVLACSARKWNIPNLPFVIARSNECCDVAI